jgi:hypothetical protein
LQIRRRRKRIVLDLDQVTGVFGKIPGVGDHDRHGLA